MRQGSIDYIVFENHKFFMNLMYLHADNDRNLKCIL